MFYFVEEMTKQKINTNQLRCGKDELEFKKMDKNQNN